MISGRLRIFSTLMLAGLLMVLALRLTMTESLYQNFQQESAQFAARQHPPDGFFLPEIGPAVTLGLSAITCLLVAGAAFCAAAAGALSLGRITRFAFIAAILVLGMLSTFAAANRFVALVGLSDIAAALLAGWAVSLLCQNKLLGAAGRRTVITFLIAVLAVWTTRGIYQRFVDIPDTIQYYQTHKDEALASQGMRPDDPGVPLYEARMMSKEVTGYVTLSNVMGAGMIGLLAVLAGVLVAKMAGLEEPAIEEKPAPHNRAAPPASNSTEISITSLLLIIAIILLIAGLVTLFLTQSRGGSIMAIVCILALGTGGFFWQRIVAHRRPLIIATLTFCALAAAITVIYGVTHDSLPSKSLMFRWHYWTASMPIIKQSPVTGVGLNNFGDYYASVKRPTSPETVQDPHSFFVRLAAEMGIPATILIAALILWMSLAATRHTNESNSSTPTDSFLLLGGIPFCILWWLLHQPLAEPNEAYNIILTFLAAIISLAGWVLGTNLISRLNTRGLRYAMIALLLGALGMLAYDQINMAVVTGPVAMLFWVMLGTADSYDAPTTSSALNKTIAILITAFTFAAGTGLTFFAWWPTLNDTMPWDPRPYIDHYLQTFATSLPDAKAALSEAIARDPRSVALHRQMMLVKERLHEPVNDEAKTILSLDHTDARIRLAMATETSSLPPDDRIRILQEALVLDAQLPAGEIMHLSNKEKNELQSALAQLQPGTTPTTSPR